MFHSAFFGRYRGLLPVWRLSLSLRRLRLQGISVPAVKQRETPITFSIVPNSLPQTAYQTAQHLPVQAKGDAAVRRRSQFQRPQQEAKFLVCLFCAQPNRLEDRELHVLLVDAQAAACGQQHISTAYSITVYCSTISLASAHSCD